METVRVNGIQLAYERRGTGKSLVLVHGYPLDHTIWNEVLPLLENDFDVILPDLRGFGQSEIVEMQYTIAEMASDIVALLDQLGINQTVIAGHSMGGYVSLAFAHAYPRRVLGLGLVSSQAAGDPPERKQGRYDGAADILANGVGRVAESMSAKLTPDERVQAYVQVLIAKQKPVGLAGALKAMAERADLTSELSAFNFPMLIIHGEADELIPIQRALDIKKAVPRAILKQLEGVGHMPMVEEPHETADFLKRYL